MVGMGPLAGANAAAGTVRAAREHPRHKRSSSLSSSRSANSCSSEGVGTGAEKASSKGAFEAWVKRKNNFDRGLELFAKLQQSRADDAESFKEVAVALAAVDKSMGVDLSAAMGKGGVQHTSTKAGPQCMFDAFKEWTKSYYTFPDVRISAAELKTLSAAMKELMVQEGEDDGDWIMPSLKYNFPPDPPRRGLKARPMTADQKAQNVIFLRRLKLAWVSANREMRERLAAMLEEGEVRRLVGRSEKGEGKEEGPESKTGEGKDGEDRPDGRSGMLHMTAESRARLMATGLSTLGVRQLMVMIEQDEDREKEKKIESMRDKKTEAAAVHAGFVRSKDEKRIRIPAAVHTVQAWKPPRFDFGSGKAVVRPNKNVIARSTLDLVRDQQGLKYVHALSKGRQGAQGDLEKCNKQLDDLRKDLKRNSGKEARDQLAEDSAKQFEGWTQHKAQVEAAVKSLSFIDPAPERGGEEYCIRVGQALKQVDVRLQKEWVNWCCKGSHNSLSAYHCQVLWDCFPPKACDVHSAGYSALRDTFLKLLRPGVDYREAFVRVVEHRRRRNAARSRDGEHYEAGLSISEEDEKLDKRELAQLLVRELGIVMGKDELSQLVDAFDKDNDQKVSWEEFKEFTGGKRGQKRGDARKRLAQRCVWATSCRETGMPNAFSLCRDGAGGGEQGDKKQSEWGGTITFATLSNKEVRRKTELPERKKRLDILRRYGLGGSEEEDEDHYSDDDEGYEDDDDHHSASGRGQTREAPQQITLRTCDQVTWGADDRQKGLRQLKVLAKANREASELRGMLDKGKPPSAPTLYAAKLGHRDVRGDDDDRALTNELLLCWQPPKDEMVAFYSLEWSGAAGTRSFRNGDFCEIYRDPPNADGDAEYQFWVTDLQPNTKYDFRMRAFNGFGPGPYTHRAFTTRPERPPQPRVERVTASEVTLRWKLSKKQLEKHEELRKVFDEVDTDRSGDVSRAELLEALQSKHTGLFKLLETSALAGAEFDAIETNDDERLSWKEFLGFFSNTGAFDGESQSATSRAGGEGPHSDQAGRYIVEQCVGEVYGQWKRVWKGSAHTAQIKMLEAGAGYRFRVQAVNGDGLQSSWSPSVVVNCLLDKPLPPKPSRPPSCTTVRLKWDSATRPRKGALRSKAHVDKMLSQWTKAPSGNDGVNLRSIFEGYDEDGNGTIDSEELAKLLEDLGVEPTKERVNEALTELDTNNDGVLSFEEFEKWWHRDDVTYVLKRDEGVSGKELEFLGDEKGKTRGAAAMNIVSFRGKEPFCEVAGLSPNTRYVFRVRIVNARTQSSLSQAAKVMTAPRPPVSPCVARAEAKAVVLKWYPGAGGAHKYRLMSRFKESLDTVGGSLVSRKSADEEWVTVYEGVDNTVKVTGLISNAVYWFRVAALNIDGGTSEWSDKTQVSTLPQDQVVVLKPLNAADIFQRDANGDVVVGDCIIFTERLYLDAKGGLVNNSVAAAAGPMGDMSCRSVLSSSSVAERGRGEFVGERTIAAHVLRDSFLSMKRKGSGTGTGSGGSGSSTTTGGGRDALLYNKHSSRRRVLRLEVIWSTVSTDEAEAFLIRSGEIVERNERSMFQFETFRALWVQDARRYSVAKEWELLSG